MGDTYSTYPDPSIDPRDKGYDFILKYSKAAWADGKSYTPATMFYYGRTRLAEIRSYALGKQSNSKYKKLYLGDDVQDKTWLNIDWTPPSFLTKFREIAISKILQRNYETECFAVDPLARSEEDAIFNQMKVKIMMREEAQKAGSDLAESPVLKASYGEPMDEEQLKIAMKYSYKHQMALESELGISLIQQQNNIDEVRKRVVECLFDYGMGGYKEWIDEHGMVKFREVVPENLITSYCLKNDFSDGVHFGEVLFLSVAELVNYFSPEQLDYICRNIAGKYGNPNSYPIANTTGRTWDRFKVAVWDLEFQSWNTTVYKKEVDNRGNIRINKADYSNYGSTEVQEFFKGQSEPKYIDTTREVWYKTKWLVGTDMMYDFGLTTNNKVKQSSWWQCKSSYHLYAWNFYNMTFTGITERLMPIEDKMVNTWNKLQQLTNELIPYLIKLDLNSLEGVNFSKGGKKMTPADLVDFIYQKFTVLYRSNDLLSKNPNYDPARIEATGQLGAYKMLYEELQGLQQLMRDISGLNEFTDGSTPNAKTLVPGINAAVQSTNNALYLIQNADKQLMNSLSDAIVQRIQVAVQLGKVEGYAKALGSDTVKFYQINPAISNYELGIFTRDAPTYEEKQAFYQDLNLKDSQGLINPADKIITMSCNNLKQAAELLAYNIDKRQQEQHDQQMQLVQQQTQGNQQVSQMTEQMKQQTIQVQLQADLVRINAQMKWEYQIAAMAKGADVHAQTIQADARNVGHEIQGEAKVEAAKIAAGANVHAKHVQGQYDLATTDMENENAKEVQHIANKKPAPKKTA